VTHCVLPQVVGEVTSSVTVAALPGVYGLRTWLNVVEEITCLVAPHVPAQAYGRDMSEVGMREGKAESR